MNYSDRFPRLLASGMALFATAMLTSCKPGETALEQRVQTLERKVAQLQDFLEIGESNPSRGSGLGAEPPARQKAPGRMKVELTNNVRNFTEAFIDNAAAFTQRYQGKGVQIAGEISKIDADGLVMRGAERSFVPVEIRFKFRQADQGQLTSLKVGQPVLVAGCYKGYHTDYLLQLEDCYRPE